MNDFISTTYDQGKGRAIVLLYQDDRFASSAALFAERLAATNRAVTLKLDPETTADRGKLAGELWESLRSSGVRQAMFIAFGAACEVVQTLCLFNKRCIRSAVYVDPEFKKESDLWSRWITGLDRYLPFGLPFRQRSNGCGISSFYQRLTSPTLIVLDVNTPESVRCLAEEMCKQQPTCWLQELDLEQRSDQMLDLLVDFKDTPAKSPQKAHSEKS